MPQSSLNNSGPGVRDRTMYYTDLGFMNPKDKNAIWFSQGLFYAKLNSGPLLTTAEKKKYRDLDRGIINKKEYMEKIDPKIPQGGKIAEYFSSSFSDCPIDQHLDNIVRAKMEKIGLVNQLQVDTIDKFAMSQKQRDTNKILWQQELRKLIAENLKVLGLPEMKNGQTVEAYIAMLKSDKGDKSKQQKGNSDKVVGSMDTLLQYIKTQIKDEHDLALYQSYVYKGDIELAFELGIQHYLMNLNKWTNEKADWFNNDIKNFNKACGRVFTDDTTGRMTVTYIEPDELYTSPFKSKNGDDILYWYHEYFMTFADFVRELGTQLNQDQLKEVFELNKDFGGSHGMTWAKSGSFKGSNARIKIGYFSVLSQDADNFEETMAVTSNRQDPLIHLYRKLDWKPTQSSPEDVREGEPRTKIYNVWYSGYYLVPPQGKLNNNSMADWAWQAQYVWKLRKDYDMYRYGVDARYAKSTLVVWKDETRMSHTDIKESIMPEIRTAWHHVQNALANNVSGTFVAHDLLLGVLNAMDEGNKKPVADKKKPTGSNGLDAGITAWRQFRQSGMGFHSFRDENGKIILEPEKLFIEYDNKQLDNAEKYLKIIMDLYNLLTIFLSQNAISQGQDPKSHTPADAVTASIQASNDGTWFIEKACREILVMFGERTVQFILYMVKERKHWGFKERFQEFVSVIGLGNSMLLESVENMWPEEIGLTVSLEDTDAMKSYYIDMTNQMLKDGKVSISDVEMVISSIRKNYKYGAILLSFAVRKQEEEEVKKMQLQQQYAMQQKEMDLKIAMTQIQGKADGKNSNIQMEAKMQMMIDEALNKLKAENMAQQKQQLLNNKLAQQNQKSELDKSEQTFDALSPAQKQ
jgi:hypothetical protein